MGNPAIAHFWFLLFSPTFIFIVLPIEPRRYDQYLAIKVCTFDSVDTH